MDALVELLLQLQRLAEPGYVWVEEFLVSSRLPPREQVSRQAQDRPKGSVDTSQGKRLAGKGQSVEIDLPRLARCDFDLGNLLVDQRPRDLRGGHRPGVVEIGAGDDKAEILGQCHPVALEVETGQLGEDRRIWQSVDQLRDTVLVGEVHVEEVLVVVFVINHLMVLLSAVAGEALCFAPCSSQGQALSRQRQAPRRTKQRGGRCQQSISI